jgi:hypothetical protein
VDLAIVALVVPAILKILMVATAMALAKTASLVAIRQFSLVSIGESIALIRAISIA